MTQQTAMIERVRDVCHRDSQLVAAMMYGSFARGEGDEHSDIEFALFFTNETLPRIDQREWVSRIAPVELYFTNEFGNGTAIFENLVRAEFHFDPASRISIVAAWRDTSSFPSLDSTVILDRTGELSHALAALIGPDPSRDTPERVRFICDSLTNWTLFGTNVLARAEYARALEILGAIHRYLLWLARLSEDSTQHWPTPSRLMERDISPEAYARYRVCTSSLDPVSLHVAYRSAWAWGIELMTENAARHGIDLNHGLLDRLDERLSRLVI